MAVAAAGVGCLPAPARVECMYAGVRRVHSRSRPTSPSVLPCFGVHTIFDVRRHWGFGCATSLRASLCMPCAHFMPGDPPRHQLLQPSFVLAKMPAQPFATASFARRFTQRNVSDCHTAACLASRATASQVERFSFSQPGLGQRSTLPPGPPLFFALSAPHRHLPNRAALRGSLLAPAMACAMRTLATLCSHSPPWTEQAWVSPGCEH